MQKSEWLKLQLYNGKGLEKNLAFFISGACIMKYYYDETGLWKKDNFQDYFFSRKNLDWIKCECVFICGSLEYFCGISEKEALTKIKEYKTFSSWSLKS